MPPKKPARVEVKSFATHQVITQPNALRAALRPVDDNETDDPVGRAEQALAGLSGEFGSWMDEECERLARAHHAILRDGYTDGNRNALFRAAHDIRGDAATFGFPKAAAVAESLCRMIEHAPDLATIPDDLIAHHVKAIQAIVREAPHKDAHKTAGELSRQLRGVADDYLVAVNRDRPEHLEAILAPSLVPEG